MKNYNTLGELIVDYRYLNNISQFDFAASMDVDIRSVQRWEKNITLLKSEKEIDLVKVSFLPYQLIRNLNSTNPIPTYYDFRIRKYSLSNLNNDLPNFDSIKDKMEISSEQVQSINVVHDLPHIIQYTEYQYNAHNIIDEQVLKQAIILLPELNLHLTDNLGFYAGHSIFLPITEKTHHRLRAKEITNSQLTIQDLVDYRTLAKPIFYAYSITADSNNNVLYLGGSILKFFTNRKFEKYLYCSCTNRYDSYNLDEHLGLELVWEEKGKHNHIFEDNYIHFYEGNFKDGFLKLG